MTSLKQLFRKSYPKNFIVRKPVSGSIIFMLFLFGFMVLYKPLAVHGARSFGLALTMFFYSVVLTIPVYVSARIFNNHKSDQQWTLSRELLSDLIMITGIGITAYFAGFIIEEPGVDRWNLTTFINSLFIGSMVGMVPVMFFSVINLRYLFAEENRHVYNPDTQKEERIVIGSKLKKEELSFYPDQLNFAESDGNYVNFYLTINEKPKKVVIRNSISNISRQLSGVSCFMRTHRAFIVNLNKVSSKRGNTLGYKIKLTGHDEEIPVSRQYTRDFDLNMRNYL